MSLSDNGRKTANSGSRREPVAVTAGCETLQQHVITAGHDVDHWPVFQKTATPTPPLTKQTINTLAATHSHTHKKKTLEVALLMRRVV